MSGAAKFLADGHLNAAEGLLIVERACREFAVRQQRIKPVELPAPPVEDLQTIIKRKVAFIIDHEKRGRWVAAGMALKSLRDDMLTPMGIAWDDFVTKNFPFGLKRADELTGKMTRGEVWSCPQCGEQTKAPCQCGVAYQADKAKPVVPSKQRALERAIAAIKAAPSKSNRLIAKEIKVDEGTVRAARKHSAQDSAPEARTGADGKQYHQPTRPDTPRDVGSACDIDWENYRDDEKETDAIMRSRAAEWQLHEANRLAEEFALRRSGTNHNEIKVDKHIKTIGKIATAWKKLQHELQQMKHQKLRRK